MSETITAKEFFTNTFELSFLSEEERQTIFTGAELYAKGKCKEQRELCANYFQSIDLGESISDASLFFSNAPEPKFGL